MPPITPEQAKNIFQTVRSALVKVGVKYQKAANIALDVADELKKLPDVTPESIQPVVEKVVAEIKANGSLFDTPTDPGAGDAALNEAPATTVGSSDVDAAATEAAADSGAALTDEAVVDIAADATAFALF
jgi:hypothetical protein